MTAEDYHVERFIGRGSFGEVYRGTNLKTGKVFALKMIDLNEANDVRELIKEIHILTRIRSTYLTRHYETFLRGTNMWIVLEYCGGGSCSDLLKCFGSLSEHVTAYIIRDVLHGLEYLHGQNKVHRDIKSANILLTDNGEVKVADFGVSGEISLTRTKRNTVVGTPYWMAPEIISRSARGYDTKADIWSTGITTYEFVEGKPPLSSVEPMKALFEIPKKRPPELEGNHYSDNIKDFVRYCLIKSPRQRPNASTLLHHQFITTCPSDVRITDLIMAKKQREETMPKKNRHKPRKIDKGLTIHWQFTSTFREKDNSLILALSKYGGIVYDALSNVLLRAKTDLAKSSVEKLRQEISEAEIHNNGLCHAFVEELFVLVDAMRQN